MKSKNKDKRIRIKSSTRKMLKDIKITERESYDEVINRIAGGKNR
jgi:hypothetical protein